jgi:hypothetical protein
MDRAEVVALLTELREAGELGSPRWNRLMESIQKHGPIHDPDFAECAACGAEYELHPYLRGRPRLYCVGCARGGTAEREEQSRSTPLGGDLGFCADPHRSVGARPEDWSDL